MVFSSSLTLFEDDRVISDGIIQVDSVDTLIVTFVNYELPLDRLEIKKLYRNTKAVSLNPKSISKALGVNAVNTNGGEISLSYNLKSSATLKIYNLNGRLLATKELNEKTQSLKLETNLATGTYLMKIVGQDIQYSEKLLLK